MGGEALKLPVPRLPSLQALRSLRPRLPRPALWDWVAIAILVGSVVLVGANLLVARGGRPGEPAPAALTMLFVFLQLAVATAGLLVLGKTAKEGTGVGNFAAIAALLLGIGGVMLAAALWAMA
jgi:hypothetical protein